MPPPEEEEYELPADAQNLVNIAEGMFDELTEGENFTIPAVDFEDEDFQFPDLPEFTFNRLTEADLTERVINGSGLFDGLMQSVRAHITKDFKDGNLTAAQMAEVYIAAIQSSMGQAVQYLLSRDTAQWQAALAERQAATAAVALVTARIQGQEAMARLAIAQSEAGIRAVDYALKKIQLATETVNAQIAEAALAKADYELDYLMPAQLADIQATTALRGSEKTKIDYENLNILPVQKQILEEDLLIKGAQKEQILYEVEYILPAQKAKLDADVEIAEYQISIFLPAQVAGINADTEGKIFNNEHLLPAQLESIQEQTESHRAKTLDTRTDGFTPVSGAMGMQNRLYEQQITSYQRDAETKAVKMILDTWITQKTMDEGLIAPTSVTNDKLDLAIRELLTNLELPIDDPPDPEPEP